MNKRRACIICGDEFTPKRVNHLTCSAACSKANKLAKWHAKIGKATCHTCGKEFQPKSPVDPIQGKSNRYCSLKCRSNDPAFFEDRGHTLRLIPVRKGQHKSAVYFNNCKVCDKLFTTKYSNKKLCSDKCRIVNNKDGYVNSYDREKVREAKKAKYIAKDITCKECGKLYKTKYGEKLKEYCSLKCSKKHNNRITKGNRRARIKGNDYESISPYKVFSRDKWVCQLCGVATPKKLRGTIESNAPEMDHIIPIAKGGAHTYNNVQCACRACNIAKADNIVGQLPMFGGRGRGVKSTGPLLHLTAAPTEKIGVTSEKERGGYGVPA